MSPTRPAVDELMAEIRANPKYARMDLALTRALVEQELAKGRSAKETVKAVRNKLHQVGGAFQEKLIDYAQWSQELAALPNGLAAPEMCAFCLQKMAWHVSTAERRPIVETFYAQTLASIAPVNSLLDLACGLNPLTYAWLPLAESALIETYDIYTDQAQFLNAYFSKSGLNGQAGVCDLTQQLPAGSFHLALLLKTIPCLEQIDKTIGRRLLSRLQAEHILVSFPGHSLSGQGKGMRANYSAHFYELIAGLDFSVQAFEFPGEIAFLLSRQAVGGGSQ